MRGFLLSKSFFNISLKTLYKFLSVFLAINMLLLFTMVFSNFISKKYFYPLKYKDAVIEYADYYGIDRALIFAVIKTESSFDEKALSKAGAIGLMQITQKTGEYIAFKLGIKTYNLIDIRTNINFGCYYIKYLFIKFDNMQTALVAYNAGEGNVSLWLADSKFSSDGKTLNDIPYKESKEYIKKINKNFTKYKKLYKKILDK